jgi:molybdopterin molybdotransferase
MRGFSQRSTVEEALAWIDAHTSPLNAEVIGLADAVGRVLAAEVRSTIDVPAFDRSAMDGYALRGSETDGAGDYNPLTFRLVGESLPGRPCLSHVPPGAAVRIMTGAPLPPGADAVLPAEFASEHDDVIEATAPVAPGKHVGRRGEDIARGSVVLSAGRLLRPQDVGVLASIGAAAVSVVRRPRVRVIVTGDELTRPGDPLPPFQIYEANSWMLRGLVARDGGVLESIQHVADQREAIGTALTAPGADVILVSGGTSIGQEDHAPSLVAEHGELAIHGIAMRPSSPAGLGRIGGAIVCLLPGNPVSCLCAYDFFAGRAIRRLGGRPADWPHGRTRARLRRKIVSAIGRVDYCRVRLHEGEVEPLALSGASILSSTTRADGFVIIPAELEGYAPGTEVDVRLYDA